jgi:hypothetical protein
MAFLQSVIYYYEGTKIFLFYTSPLLLLIWLFIMKKIWGRHPIEAIIIERRGDNLIKTNDRLGKFDNLKEGDVVCYKFKKTKDTIPVADYDWIMHNVFVPGNIFERFVNLLRGNLGTIFLFRYGSKQYKPIKISEKNKEDIKFEKIKDKKGNDIWTYHYEPINFVNQLGHLEFMVVDWDNINFMVQEQRASVLRRQKRGEFLKGIILPLAILGICGLVGILAMKFSLDYGRELRVGYAPPSEPTPEKPLGDSALGKIGESFVPG